MPVANLVHHTVSQSVRQCICFPRHLILFKAMKVCLLTGRGGDEGGSIGWKKKVFPLLAVPAQSEAKDP
ncbi:MAG: hypothetical protein KKH04_08745 [Proteobacteria bacterium]|nr:hypothetical protein [Pseudomonadota bacterium]